MHVTISSLILSVLIRTPSSPRIGAAQTRAAARVHRKQARGMVRSFFTGCSSPGARRVRARTPQVGVLPTLARIATKFTPPRIPKFLGNRARNAPLVRGLPRFAPRSRRLSQTGIRQSGGGPFGDAAHDEKYQALRKRLHGFFDRYSVPLWDLWKGGGH